LDKKGQRLVSSSLFIHVTIEWNDKRSLEGRVHFNEEKIEKKEKEKGSETETREKGTGTGRGTGRGTGSGTGREGGDNIESKKKETRIPL
jgi:hypothetical protein